MRSNNLTYVLLLGSRDPRGTFSNTSLSFLMKKRILWALVLILSPYLVLHILLQRARLASGIHVERHTKVVSWLHNTYEGWIALDDLLDGKQRRNESWTYQLELIAIPVTVQREFALSIISVLCYREAHRPTTSLPAVYSDLFRDNRPRTIPKWQRYQVDQCFARCRYRFRFTTAYCPRFLYPLPFVSRMRTVHYEIRGG